jgi:Tol biopolymer transport system component
VVSGAAGVATPLTPAPAARRRWAAPLSGALLLAVLGAFGWWLLSSWAPKRSTDIPTVSVKVTPFTSDGGEKRDPALSPDGELVAYSWAGPADDNWDIYVKGRGPGTRPLRLTENPSQDRSPVWSPDGRQIAFVRDLDGGPAIYTAPWPSGQERRLIQLTGPINMFGDYYFVTILSWSPDGEWLAFVEKPSADEPARIVRLALATLEKQPLTSPPSDTGGDFYPALSPNGSQLAFVRSSTGGYGNQDVWVQPAGGPGPRQLTFERYAEIGGLAWTPDGREIVFTILYPRRTILRVSLAGGEPRPVAGVGQGAGLPSIRGSRMVYDQQTAYPGDFWRVPGRGASAPGGEPERLIASSGSDYHPAYSPDGRRIAFSSSRSGVGNIWVCESDGSSPVQLTDYASHTGTARWSPDGHRIVFDSVEAGDGNIYTIDAEGGIARRLTPEPSEEIHGGPWSHDGQWIYFRSNRTGEGQIWKIPAEGGTPVQVTRGGGFYAAQWCDSSYLYYAKSDSPTGIWRVPVGGGEETEVFSGPIGAKSWALSSSGIYYYTATEQARRREYTILYRDSQSGRVTELFRREGPISFGTVLAVSPDERWILYGERPLPTSELMLVENFR